MRIALIALLGLVFATGLGFAAHVIARDTVALPVASLDARENLAPTSTTGDTRIAGQTTTARREARTATTPVGPGPVTTRRTTAGKTVTDEDGEGRGRNRGRGRSGGDSSGSGSSGSGSGSLGSGSSGSGSSGGDDSDD